MASTVDLSTTYFSARAAKGIYQRSIASFYIDFSATGQSLAQNETMTIVDLPAGCIIYGGMIDIETAQATISDVDLGVSTDGTTAADLADGITLAATGFLAFNNVTAGGVKPVAASNLVFTNKDAQTLNSAKVRVKIDIAFFTQD